MSFYWSFFTVGTSIRGRLNCWPIVPGSLTIRAFDGLNPERVLADNGDGTLSGNGIGVINYSWGTFGFDFSDPVPNQGTEIRASYNPVEGGCAEDCGKCATHYLRLDITPSATLRSSISGSDEFTMQDAWERLFKKIRRDILPIHLEILSEVFEEEFVLKVGHRFDMIDADVEYLDEAELPEEIESGLKVVFDDTSW